MSDYGAVAIESLLLTLLVTVILYLGIDWQFEFIFVAIFVVAIILLLLRAMAIYSDESIGNRIHSTLKWSSICMDILLIGALISISFQLETLIGISPKIGWFIVLAFGIFLLVFVMDEYYLGNFTKTWLNEVNRDRYDDPVGKWVQKQLQTAKSLVDSIFRNREPTTESLDLLTTLKLFGLYILLMAFLSPIWILISLELGNVGFAIILIIAVFVTRDLSRYMYLAYGKAKNLDDLAPRMSYGYILLGIKAIIIIGAFGYAFPIIST